MTLSHRIPAVTSKAAAAFTDTDVELFKRQERGSSRYIMNCRCIFCGAYDLSQNSVCDEVVQHVSCHFLISHLPNHAFDMKNTLFRILNSNLRENPLTDFLV